MTVSLERYPCATSPPPATRSFCDMATNAVRELVEEVPRGSAAVTLVALANYVPSGLIDCKTLSYAAYDNLACVLGVRTGDHSGNNCRGGCRIFPVWDTSSGSAP